MGSLGQSCSLGWKLQEDLETLDSEIDAHPQSTRILSEMDLAQIVWPFQPKMEQADSPWKTERVASAPLSVEDLRSSFA